MKVTKHEILIKQTENSIEYRYMNTAFNTRELAQQEVDRILKSRAMSDTIPYYIKINEIQVTPLNKPIYPF